MLLPHERLSLYALKGERKLWRWCRDKQNTWQTELRDGHAPEPLNPMKLDFSAIWAGKSIQEARMYDPWKDRWSKGVVDGESVVLPEFSRSLVVQIGVK